MYLHSNHENPLTRLISEYGECGVGAYCLGGCDPMHSFMTQSCVAEPSCKSQKYKFDSLDNIVSNTKYLGDPSKADWVSSGQALEGPDGQSVILTLAEDGASASGTLLASTVYVWYGKITATMKTSRGAGVVSAFILLSDSKDEIDFEFVGTDLETAQSNYYYQGITNCGFIVLLCTRLTADDNEKNITVQGADTFSDWHTYVIDWQPDQLTWSVDGKIARTLKRSETLNKTDNVYHYPQSPARVQLSLWPAGLAKNGQGTVEWAGGQIDWSQKDPKTNGYYYSMFKDVEIQCYDPPSDANVTGKTSYIFNDRTGLQKSIARTDDNTVLKSLLGTGTDMDKDYPNAQASGTNSASGASASNTNVATVPGLTGAGPGTDGSRGGDSTGSSGGAGTGSGTSSSTGVGGFVQDSTKSGTQNNGGMKNEQVFAGSMFAALMAGLGLLVL